MPAIWHRSTLIPLVQEIRLLAIRIMHLASDDADATLHLQTFISIWTVCTQYTSLETLHILAAISINQNDLLDVYMWYNCHLSICASMQHNFFLSCHYRTPSLCREPEALGKDEFTLGNLFAESSSRQIAVGKTSTGKGFFTESPSRQNIYRE